MRHVAFFLVVSFVLATATAVAEQASQGKGWHSGRIVEVAPDRSAIVLEELVTWTGPGTGIVTRSIQLTSRTSIRLVERTKRRDGDRTSMPGWDVEMMDAASLRKGDFVTVTTHDGPRAVAAVLQVVRPGE